jgi:hypothetical protein
MLGLSTVRRAIVTALLAGGPVVPAHAHLSIIRQGYECAGENEVQDLTGHAVAAGDFNGDGFGDLAIGAVYETVDGKGFAGSVIICWGSRFGVTHEGSLAITSGDVGGMVEQGENFGAALAAGDFDGDGDDDLAIGAPGWGSAAGRVYVVHWSDWAFFPSVVLEQSDWLDAIEALDQFGYALAAGSIDGDAYDDLAIGSPGENNAAGMMHYALGSASGLVPTDGSIGTGTPEDRFGFSLAIGNVVGDSAGDLVVGLPWRDTATGLQDIGQIWVFPGNSFGLGTPTMYFAPDGPAPRALFGYSVACGDFFGTGAAGTQEAVAVGEPFRTVSGDAEAGRVVVMRGAAGGLQTSNPVIVTESIVGGTIDPADRFGTAVAGGSFWDPADGYEDLAVGVPGDRHGTAGSAGSILVINGGANGPDGSFGWSGFNQGTLNEFVEGGDLLGMSVCFGAFDETGFGNVAVGAPGEDTYAGMVHVIAPWRQTFLLSCERSIVYDCDHNIIFSQKPFDRVMIASTTKIMTVLIAAERSQLPPSDPQYVDLDAAYVVPAWVADQIPGSQVPLVTGEWMTLRDLMYSCLMRSGNDAAFAIADLLHGSQGPWVSLLAFVAEMNARAAALGMANTHFHNPSGLDNEPVGYDLGDHYSTPFDMGTLSRAAMENPLVAQIAGTTTYDIMRHYTQGDVLWTCMNIFGGVLTNNVVPMNGIKGGATPGAQATGCFSARNPDTGGDALAGHYTTPLSISDFTYVPNAVSLMALGLGACGYEIDIPDDWVFSIPVGIAGIPSDDGERRGMGGELPGDGSDAAFSLFRTLWNGRDASLQLDVRRTSEIMIEPDVPASFGIAPFDRHGELRILNMGDATVEFVVSFPWGDEPVVLRSGEALVLPPTDPAGIMGELSWAIQSTDGMALHLSVEESYGFDVVTGDVPTYEPVFQAVLARDPAASEDGFDVQTTGMGPDGSLFYLAMHGEEIVVSTPGSDALAPGAGLVAVRAPYPNPFRSQTRVGFDLAQGGEVSAAVFDVRGRRVRSFEPRQIQAGSWGFAWDGTTDAGLRVAPGSYFYEITFDGRRAARGKITLLD